MVGKTIVEGLVVIIIIVAAALLLSSPLTTHTISQTSIAGSQSAPNSTSQNASSSGPNQPFISDTEAVRLMGPEGRYNVSYIPGTSGPKSGGDLTNNVTATWIVSYVFPSIDGAMPMSLSEIVGQSSKAQLIYAAELSRLRPSFIVYAVNATLDGLTYSYSNLYIGGSSYGRELLGYKDGEFILVLSTSELNQTTLAAIVANDIP